MKKIKLLLLVSTILLTFSCGNSNSVYVGNWQNNNSSTISITKSSDNFIIAGADIAGIYVKTKEGNLSGFNGFILISYDKKNQRLIVNVTGSSNPVTYWTKIK